MTTEIVDEFTRRSRRLPRWLLGTVGVACLLLGVAIIFKPFSSLTVLILAIIAGLVAAGIAELAGASDEPSPAMARIAGAVWLAAALIVAVWPGATIGVLALVVGVALVVEGALKVVGGLRGTADQRATAVISGLAGVVFGVLALAWPDVTLFVVAVVFGTRLILFGVTSLWAAIREGRAVTSTDEQPSTMRQLASDVDYDDYVRPTARIQLREMASRCLSDPGTGLGRLVVAFRQVGTQHEPGHRPARHPPRGKHPIGFDRRPPPRRAGRDRQPHPAHDAGRVRPAALRPRRRRRLPHLPGPGPRRTGR
jgi:uncharacterized membrane protein HdeD (DUF308 family)